MPKNTARKATNTNERDDLLDAALERYDDLLMVYKTFEDKEQVLLYDLQEQRIYSYPTKSFETA